MPKNKKGEEIVPPGQFSEDGKLKNDTDRPINIDAPVIRRIRRIRR